ncbi:DDE-1 domain-containing protein [Trichonephila clavipes]|nr:DDE-1 domain-containing protein [Trichonephila clavipes]
MDFEPRSGDEDDILVGTSLLKFSLTPYQTGLDCPIVLLEEFIGVEDGNMCTAPIMADKDILEFVESSKNIDVDADSENEMNIASLVPTIVEMRIVVKSMCSYLAAHSNGEINNKLDDIPQFVDSFMLK